ncbi:ankyrin repeat domain-containing protein 13C [Anastrepha obliqua]|uniref:ankyrin repeat domain-containing protein 13C n=1 Tax=Anastrepha obliqua TaxID=95512 RepID=UPI002409243F|nr:ankyrin repeat domain-containing protein 13C [Anastrepha obliqua]
MSKEKEENQENKQTDQSAGGSGNGKFGLSPESDGITSCGTGHCSAVQGAEYKEHKKTALDESPPSVSLTPTPTPSPTTDNRREGIGACSSNTLCENEDYALHKSVFEGDFKRLARLIQRSPAGWQPQEKIACKDKHGNTPLHLAVMLGRKECIHLLLAHGAPVKVKNNEGWSPLAEAISYGDRQTISAVLRKLKQQSRQHMEARRAKLVRALQQMKDFYMELKWDFASWVPLVSRMLPSDICRIHKSGATLRLDTTLVDFNDMRWERGDISFIFRGDRPPHESLTVLDNEYECYQHVRYEDADIEDEVDVLMSTDILAAQMSTKSIQFARAQSGWIFREDRKELVSGQYQCDLYSIQGLVLKQRKRREHLSHEDLQKNRAIVDSITRGGRRASVTSANGAGGSSGESANGSATEMPRRSSLQPPNPPTATWEEYINAPAGKCPQLGRPPVHKQSNKTIRATVAMSKDFPLSVEMLLNVLEVIAPFKHINKLREFVTLKLPSGFPVKVEIPVLHTVTAKITFQKFEFRDNIPETLFVVPSHYVEDARRFPDL